MPNDSNNQTPQSPPPRISVREFRPDDLGQVQRMFTEGMMFYASDLYYKLFTDYVAESLVGDLADIPGTYFSRGGGFWVATLAQDDDEKSENVVVGMVALEKHTDGRAEVRRVSIKAEYRRYGVGRILMAHVEQWARAHDLRSLFLHTGMIMTHAQKFYESLDYVVMGTQLFCEQPYYFQVVYAKQL